MIEIDEEIIEAAAIGGGVLGGGGGGSIKEGIHIGKLALSIGEPKIASIEEISKDSTLITVSMVGAPTMKGYVKPIHSIKAIELLQNIGMKIDGFISSENGGTSSLNGWFQSAVFGIPVVDAPCDGRAHPTALMGSMGLHKIKNYISIQSAVGGNLRTGKYIEILIKGNLIEISKFIRQASISAGGLVAVARNPISLSYIKENAAIGAITQAIEIGKAMLKAKKDGAKEMIEAASRTLNGKIVSEGIVKEVKLETKGGFDIGSVLIKSNNGVFLLTFWNEYMTLEINKKRIGTFPDLITTLSLENGLPIPSAEIKKGMKVAILHAPKENLKLGSGIKDPEILKEVEKSLRKRLYFDCLRIVIKKSRM